MAEPTDPVDPHLAVSPEAEAARLRRQVDALQRQLEHRIRQVDHLQRRVGELETAPATLPPPDAVVHELGRKAAAYDNLMG